MESPCPFEPRKSQLSSVRTAGKASEEKGTRATGTDEVTTVAKMDETTVGTEMTEVATDAPTAAKAAETIEAPEMEVKTSEPTTIGPVQNATTPTLPAARSATDAKSPDPVVAASATTVAVIDTSTTAKADGITVDSETTVAEITVDSETTVAVIDTSTTGKAAGITVDSETTVGVETRADHSGTPSTITIGPVRNVTTPTSRSETSATDARHLDQVAAVAVVNEAEAALPMVANATTGVKVAGTETIVVTEVETDAHLTADSATKGAEASGTVGDETVAAADKVAGKAAVTTAHVVEVALNVVGPLMEAFEEPKASAPAMPITVHLKISERPVHLNEKKTEWT